MNKGKWNKEKLMRMVSTIPNFAVSVYAERHRNLRQVVRKASKEGLVEVTRRGGMFYVKGK